MNSIGIFEGERISISFLSQDYLFATDGSNSKAGTLFSIPPLKTTIYSKLKDGPAPAILISLTT
ncbi:MAG: hypothetical protein ACKPB3_06255, partial [Bacteroidota bacterium]